MKTVSEVKQTKKRIKPERPDQRGVCPYVYTPSDREIKDAIEEGRREFYREWAAYVTEYDCDYFYIDD